MRFGFVSGVKIGTIILFLPRRLLTVFFGSLLCGVRFGGVLVFMYLFLREVCTGIGCPSMLVSVCTAADGVDLWVSPRICLPRVCVYLVCVVPVAFAKDRGQTVTR